MNHDPFDLLGKDEGGSSGDFDPNRDPRWIIRLADRVVGVGATRLEAVEDALAKKALAQKEASIKEQKAVDNALALLNAAG